MREFSSQVVEGKLPEGVSKAVGEAIRRLDGKRVVLTVREAKPRRSGNQNRYYYGVVVPAVTQMFRDYGNVADEDDAHTYLKMHVGKLGQVMVTPDGEVKKSLRSTAKLSKSEFEAYLMKIRAWAAEYGLAIPEPNEEV